MFNNLNKTQLFGQCRCCLDFGNHEEIDRNGKVYRQTFLETFNLCLSSNPCLPSMICESCIHRLTDAAEFIAMVKESEQYLLNNTESTSNIEFINVAQEEEIMHQNELIKEEEDDPAHGQDVNLSGSVDGDTMIGLEAEPRLQVKLTRLPDKLLKLYIKHDYMNKSSDAENEVPIYNDESSAIKTELLEQISQEYEQIDDASKGTECEDNIGEEIDEQNAAIDDQAVNANVDFTSRDLKLMRAVAVRTHAEVKHPDTHTDSARSLNGADDYAPRTQITATRCGINEINKSIIASISPDSDINTYNSSSLHTNVNKCPANIKQMKAQHSEVSIRNEHKCFVCKYTTNEESALEYHLKMHSATTQFICDACSYITHEKKILIRHLTLHPDEFSDNKFCRDSDLKSHGGTYTGVKPYKCEICSHEFSNKSKFNRHIRTHKGVKPYKCQICNKEVFNRTSLNRHMVTHTGINPFKCEICNKEFALKSYVKTHIRTHTGIKPYKCEICNKEFSQKCYLLTHNRTHTGIKPYKCEICSHDFSIKSHLNRHLRTHTGVKPYQCEICRNWFSQKNHLNSHMATHTGIKPYECEVCRKRFSRKNYLDYHIRIHTGINSVKRFDYECDMCGKKCSLKESLKKHIRTHTHVKPYKCVICDKEFSDKSYLNSHMKTKTMYKGL